MKMTFLEGNNMVQQVSPLFFDKDEKVKIKLESEIKLSYIIVIYFI